MVASKKLIGAIGAAALSFGVMSASAQAEDRQFGWTWTVTGASDYIFRGISYTSEDATVNSYLEFTYGIMYLGLWTSNIDTGATGLGPWEQDVYVGIRPVTGPINWDISALWYIYGNKGVAPFDSTWDVDYVEFKIYGYTNPVKDLTLGLAVYLTPDQGFAATENISVEGSVAYNLPQCGIFAPQLSALVGFSDSQANSNYPDGGYWAGDDHYTYWNAGLKVTVEKFFMDFRYWDTDLKGGIGLDGLADARFVFSAGVALP